jgi:hypothetical protein
MWELKILQYVVIFLLKIEYFFINFKIFKESFFSETYYFMNDHTIKILFANRFRRP